MATQQEIIKKFMNALDNTTLTGDSAVDYAISYATDRKFVDMASARAQMVKNCKQSASGEAFLKNYCGIVIGNADTGAITGADAGGRVKIASSIVPEYGKTQDFTANVFTTNGLTVKLTDKTYNELSTYEKYVWNNLASYWIKNSLDLIAESYGDSYVFDSNVGCRELNVEFINANTGYAAIIEPIYTNGNKKLPSSLKLTINLYYYASDDDFNVEDTNGEPNWLGKRYNASYLDRSIAHELTHAVMQARIDYFNRLPTFITEGMAELTHGADDGAYIDDIKALSSDYSKFEAVLSGENIRGIGNSAYAGGYMFLRWLAKQCSTSKTNNLTVNNTKNTTIIGGTNGNDKITNNGANVTLIGGDGNDTLTNSGANVTFYYRNGDVNDIINGFNATSTLSIADSYSTVKNGSDIVVFVGDDRITLRNATNIGGLNVEGTLESSFSDSNDKIHNVINFATINAGKGNDSIVNSGENVTFVYNSGDGNDIINGFKANSMLSIVGSLYSSQISGSDMIFTVGSGKITLTGVSKSEIHIDGREFVENLTLSDRDDAKIILSAETANANASSRTKSITIIGNNQDNSIMGGKSDDKLLGGNGNDTLSGNFGNDTLWGGLDADYFIYRGGNDVIADYTVGETIKFSSAIKKTALSGNDAVFTTKNGTLTVRNGKKKTLNIITASGELLSTLISNSVTLNDKSSAKITLPGTYGKANASLRTKPIVIVGNGLDNTILGGKSGDKLLGGSGNDILSGNSGNDKLWGGSGDDILNGGAGNDSLWGGNGVDTFIYDSGDGKDMIFGFEDDDLLQINGEWSASYYKVAKKLSIKVGSGNITLKDITATNFNINGENYVLSEKKLIKRSSS